MKRRSFLKTVALAGGAASEARPIESEAGRRTGGTGTAKRAAAIEYPRKFTGRQRAMIAFPLGGVGAGSISLGGRGQLRDWEIFNKPDKGRTPIRLPGHLCARGIEEAGSLGAGSDADAPVSGQFRLGNPERARIAAAGLIHVHRRIPAGESGVSRRGAARNRHARSVHTVHSARCGRFRPARRRAALSRHQSQPRQSGGFDCLLDRQPRRAAKLEKRPAGPEQ